MHYSYVTIIGEKVIQRRTRYQQWRRIWRVRVPSEKMLSTVCFGFYWKLAKRKTMPTKQHQFLRSTTTAGEENTREVWLREINDEQRESFAVDSLASAPQILRISGGDTKEKAIRDLKKRRPIRFKETAAGNWRHRR